MSNDDLAPLTQREVEVIELVANGFSNLEVAETLAITVHTVKVHLKHIFAKLEATKRTQAVARARELGFLGDEPANISPAHNLPRSLIPLIGRNRELADLAGYLADTNHRLITVHGPGGIGKTHLAVEAAWQHVADFQDGVYWVALEPLESSLFLLSAIAESIGFQFAGQQKRKEQLRTYLSDKHLLLVMDGFEHLLDNTALIGDLLAAAPALKVMVTSRERLNIHGEMLYRLQGISYPGEQATELADSDAVALFRYCVERVLPGFQPDTNDLARIAEICRFVEGLPLGILLAASWANAISIQDILTEIQQHAHALETDALSTLFQYKGLRYVFQRSWDQLDPSQRDAFVRLTVFRGSFTRAAAQHVAAASPYILSTLVNKAMLEWNPLHKHYRIHRLLRQYGLQQLQAVGEEENTREAHFDFFAQFAQIDSDDLKEDADLRQAWDYAIADLRAALQWAYAHGHIDRMIELCLAMDPYWRWYGYFQEYLDWLTQALGALAEPTTELHARALRNAGETAWKLGRLADNRNFTRQSIRLWYQFEKPDEICRALSNLGDLEHVAGNYHEATEHYNEVLAVASETQNKTFMVMGLSGLGMVAEHQQQYSHALTAYGRSLDYARQMNNLQFISSILCNMGVVAVAQGEFDKASRFYTEALDIARADSNLVTVVTVLANLSEVALRQQDYPRARQLGIESLVLAHQIGFRMAVAHQLEVIARIENLEGDAAGAARLYGAAEALREAIEFPIPPRERPDHNASIETIRGGLAEDDFEAAWTSGRTAGLDALITGLTAS